MAAVSTRTHLPNDPGPGDYSDDMAECLLFYFNRFQWLEVKNEIEETCGIKNEHLWSGEDIKRALAKIDKMEKEHDHRIKLWACVITFQIMQMLDLEKHKASESSLTESENVAKLPSSAIGVKIPLLELFDSKATSEPPKPVSSEYKLIDGCPSEREIIKMKSYVLSYNRKINNAEWVYEILNKQTLADNYSGNCKFPECEIEEGYNRGHLAAAANHRWCKEAYKETYELINISPQLCMLNGGMWKDLEADCHTKVNNQRNVLNVHVYTGTIVLDSQTVGQRGNMKATPDYFYKVIIVENVDGTVLEPVCYLINNIKTELINAIDRLRSQGVPKCNFLDSFKVDITEIEGLSGLNFCVNNIRKYRDEIWSVTWTGEDDIAVRITIPQK